MNDIPLEESIEHITAIIDDFMNDNYLDLMNPKIKDIILKNIKPILCLIYNKEVSEDIDNDIYDIDDLLNMSIDTYFGMNDISREIHSNKVKSLNKEYVNKRLIELRNIPLPAQNTPEWFDYRWNRLTASSAWKALSSDAMVNSLIYSKCKPIDRNKNESININSPTHHGHKFEPVSTILYEKRFDTTIEEFGCIPDPTSPILAASPDGVNVKEDSPLYGRLLEIKNPVSRIPTGSTKLDYWVQMQFQMHVIGLHVCDFLETCFKEYENETEFNEDGSFTKTRDGKDKGIIVCLNDGKKPIYLYPPLGLSQKEFDEWYDKMMDDTSGLTWIKNTYWYLDIYSCVTVKYNKKWFDIAVPYFTNVWNIIEKERISGYAHRGPKKRVVKNITNEPQNTIIPPKMTLMLRTSSL
jgi:hypothetical protein